MGSMILVEGLDLAGKSTLVRELGALLQEMGVPHRVGHNSLCPDNPVAQFADWMRQDERRSSLEGSCLFVASHLWDMRNFRAPVQTVHLQDSCWLRSVAYDLESEARSSPRAGQLWESCPTVQFDRALFLTASLPVRRLRLQKRKREGGAADAQDHWVETNPERFSALESRLLQVVSSHARTEILDSSELSPREVLRESLKKLDLGHLASVAWHL